MILFKRLAIGLANTKTKNFLDSLIKQIEAIRGDFDLDKIFSVIGKELSSRKISVLFSVYDKPKNEIVVRYLSLAGGEEARKLQKIKKKIVDYTRNFDDSPFYQDLIKKKSPQFYSSRKPKALSQAGMFTILGKNKLNCISIPVFLGREVIAVIEYFGPELKEDKINLYNNFSLALMRNISNIILFNEIKKSEKRYRDLFDNANEAVLALDVNGKITMANNSFFRITGHSLNELPLDFLNMVHIDDRKSIKERFKKRLDGKEIGPFNQFRAMTKDGKVLYVRYSANNILEKGAISGIQIIARDITDRHLLEEKIINAKLHYEQIFDTITDSICVINKNFLITGCNRDFALKVGMHIKDIVGKPCNQVIPKYEKYLLKQHCSRTACDNTCGSEQVFKEGKTKLYIEKNLDKNGKSRYHHITIYPAKNKLNEIYQVVLTIREVTETVEAQEKIKKLSEFNQRILDTAPISIAVLDKTGTIIVANKLAKKMIESAPHSAIGVKLTDTKNIKNNRVLIDMYNKLLAVGKPFSYKNLSRIDKVGLREKFLNIYAVPLIDQDTKKVNGAISMALDTTDTVLATRELIELNRTLENKVAKRTSELSEINKRLSQAIGLKLKFITDASHELRTPLTVIHGNLDLAIRENKNNKIPELYDLILIEVEKMTDILSDLTMLTNADSNSEHISYDKVDLSIMVQAATRSLRVLADQKKISLIFKQRIKSIKVMGDEAKLEKLLINIVRNAIKYTEKKGKIEIWTESKDKFACIFIKDTGIGIPPQDLPFIFERFYRVDKARSREEGGTGLGLSICKWIAEMHNGKIDVESEFGKGSTFSVCIPYDYKNLK